jgi:UvrD/REP helicase N-terminal domain
VCICERIARDRHHAEVGKQFSQLFVARSRGICKIVSSLVGSEYDENDQHLRNVEYITFTKLINKCNETLQQADDPLPFDPAYRVDFRRFKRDFPWVCKCDVDALVIWTQIRSFIKGSIEALVKGRPKYLGLQEYLDMEVFSVARCRLSKLQREKAYEAFLRYENEKRRNNLWDDCDRISALHTGLETATRELGSIPAGLLFDRVYVDEVQDYTQQEIALFFKLCKPGQLFLAGDPAQAVVGKFGLEYRPTAYLAP